MRERIVTQAVDKRLAEPAAHALCAHLSDSRKSTTSSASSESRLTRPRSAPKTPSSIILSSTERERHREQRVNHNYGYQCRKATTLRL